MSVDEDGDSIKIDTNTLSGNIGSFSFGDLTQDYLMANIFSTTTVPGIVSNVNAVGTYITNTGTYSTGYTTGIYNSGTKTLEVNGDAKFHGDILLGETSLKTTLENIEKRLAILHPNVQLESRWEKLKNLGEEYRKLEKEILEKEQIWSTLKK